MLFQDDFNGAAGTRPSSTLWAAKGQNAVMHGSALADWNGWQNIALDGNGNVVITARRQPTGRWLSGWLTGKIPYTGPRHIEARAKVAAGVGTWNAPAWEWAYPYGSPWSEVDVCEQLGREPQAYHTTLHASATAQAGFANAAHSALAAAFHIYGASVHSDRVDFYLDGVLVRTVTKAQLGGLWPFLTTKTIPNISLNIGGWGGTPTIPGPASLVVDYIRVTALSS